MDRQCIDHFQAGKPLAAGHVTLIPVEHVLLYWNQDTAGYWVTAWKQPYAIIILDGKRISISNIAAKEINYETLTGLVPGLDALLASLQH